MGGTTGALVVLLLALGIAEAQLVEQLDDGRAFSGLVLPSADQPLVNTEALLIESINSDRVRAGLAPAVPNEWLASTARLHSLDMSEQERYYHDSYWWGLGGSFNGENVWRRYPAHDGYCSRASGACYGPWTLRTVDSVIHFGFMESPGHRANILHKCRQDEQYLVGIGLTEGPDHVYVTERFACVPKQ